MCCSYGTSSKAEMQCMSHVKIVPPEASPLEFILIAACNNDVIDLQQQALAVAPSDLQGGQAYLEYHPT